MNKPELCEWHDCPNPPKIKAVLDGDTYWFCSHKCLDAFWDWLVSTGNY